MICTHPLHLLGPVLQTAPEVAAADHDADLQTVVHTTADDVADLPDDVKVQAAVGFARQSLAADFQQHTVIFQFTGHKKHSF